jgi:hypothetical protein
MDVAGQLRGTKSSLRCRPRAPWTVTFHAISTV